MLQIRLNGLALARNELDERETEPERNDEDYSILEDLLSIAKYINERTLDKLEAPFLT